MQACEKNISENHRTAVFEGMNRGKPIFSTNAVGVSFLNPEKTGTVHIDVCPDTGTIVVAEAHTIRMRGAGVSTEILNELGDTAAKLLSEYLSNHLLNAKHSDNHIDVKDPSFQTLLGQTASGLDQLLIEAVTSEGDNVVAYKMRENRHKIQAPSTQSLLNKITNSLEAIVYFNGGLHISHRGESQQYLVTRNVQKLTEDHMAGGLFSAIGDVDDFIPQIHTDTVGMAPNDRLVIFSREASVSSFPLNHLKHWLGHGDPKAQAQRVAEELKKLGKETGCVLVFSPSFTGSPSDDIAVNGVFSLSNLANLKRQPTGQIQTGQSIPLAEPSADAAVASAQMETASPPTASKRNTMVPKKRNSRAAKSNTTAPVAPSVAPSNDNQPELNRPKLSISTVPKSVSARSKPKPTAPKAATAQSKSKSTVPKSSIPKAIAALSNTSISPGNATSANKNDSLTSWKESITKSKKNSTTAKAPRHSGDSPIAEPEIQLIAEAVLKQLNPHLEKIENKLQIKLENRFLKLKGDVSNLVGEESTRILKKLTADNLPGIEHRITHTVHDELSQLENRLRGLMDESLHHMQNDTASELSQGTLNAKELLQNHPGSPKNILETPVVHSDPNTATTENAEELSLFFNDEDEEDTQRLKISQIGVRQPTAPHPPKSKFSPPDSAAAHQLETSDTLSSDYIDPIQSPQITATGTSTDTFSASRESLVKTLEPEPLWGNTATRDSQIAMQLTPEKNQFMRLPQIARISIALGILALLTSAVVFFIFPIDTNGPPKTPARKKTPPLSGPIAASIPNTKEVKNKFLDTRSNEIVSTPPPPTLKPNASTTQPESAAPPVESALAAVSDHLSTMPPQEVYEKGLGLYLMGDLGKTQNKRRLNSKERRAALLKAHTVLVHLAERMASSENRKMNNVWFLKGRTEYNLTKTETSTAKRRALAQSALDSYKQYKNGQRKIPRGKAKTIKRNQTTLRRILK